MKNYLAYIRVSTVRQGEKGSSLQEQRAAIEAYATRHALTINEWYEERETAAKLGRPVFSRMLRALENGRAVGVVTHKIDRSARNLKDWAALGELLDRGIELHFAHESIDLTSRGGRLSADIQAVVAADYIRNLREEVRKGFYGRLRQGLYPIRAPIGYLDRGRGLPKEIDSIAGPLIAKAFELYASGEWTLKTIGAELHVRGLRNRGGGRVTRNGWSTIFNNPFYVGLIRIKRTREVFQGIHAPLIAKDTFDAVQAVLRGRLSHRANRHRFRYQRMIRCASCDYSLIAERQKGHVYYRCHSPACPVTSLREKLIDAAVEASVRPFELTEDEVLAVKQDIAAVLEYRKADAAGDLRAVNLNIAAVDERMTRLTDAYVDRMIERDVYLQRKERLLHERAGLVSRKAAIEAGDDGIGKHAEKILELIKSLGLLAFSENEVKAREILKMTTSNLTASGKYVAIAWRNPFQQLAKLPPVTSGDPYRDEPRTRKAQAVADIIMQHCDIEQKCDDGSSDSLPLAA